jgi:hypothetical protein
MAKSAIELAKEYGIDYKQLRWFRSLTPTERLLHLEAMVELTFAAQAARERRKKQRLYGGKNQL